MRIAMMAVALVALSAPSAHADGWGSLIGQIIGQIGNHGNTGGSTSTPAPEQPQENYSNNTNNNNGGLACEGKLPRECWYALVQYQTSYDGKEEPWLQRYYSAVDCSRQEACQKALTQCFQDLAYFKSVSSTYRIDCIETQPVD